MLGNAISCLQPRLLPLRARSLSSVNPLNKCDAQSNLRFISLGRVQCGYPNVLRTFSMTGSFVHILHFILFSKGRLKRNIMPKKLEKKRQELFTKAKQRCHDRSVLPLRLTGCTFQKPVAKITFHPGDVVRCHWCERTLGEAAASLCIQEAAGAPGLQLWRRTFQNLGQHKCFWGYCPGIAGEFLGHVGSRSLHTRPELITFSLQIRQRWTQDWSFISHRSSADGQKQMQIFADSLR